MSTFFFFEKETFVHNPASYTSYLYYFKSISDILVKERGTWHTATVDLEHSS